ncbi:riboflavin biosynthesis protein RibF [Candidatus Fermentibacteria bacterium]|nr:riboflavin biosynthesis protein RibF [Candidatus Fermentibacteria bacterium]
MTGCAVSVGVFDGVHRGHQEIIRLLAGQAARRSIPSVVLTFDPHPRPEAIAQEGGLLLSPDERGALLRALGVQWVVVLRFTESIKTMPAERFFHEVLLARLGARVVIVGPTHHFGYGGTGEATLLRRLGAAAGVDVVIAPETASNGLTISSRRIRSYLAAGRVVEAADGLGRPYRLDGTVVRGSGIGRELGFPTANLEAASGRIIPGDGVYGCVAHLDEGRFPAVVNIGFAPTIRGLRPKQRRVEVHLIDHDAVLYSRSIGISFFVRIREERRFVGAEDLRQQIAEDVGRIRTLTNAGADQSFGNTAGNNDPFPFR